MQVVTVLLSARTSSNIPTPNSNLHMRPGLSIWKKTCTCKFHIPKVGRHYIMRSELYALPIRSLKLYFMKICFELNNKFHAWQRHWFIYLPAFGMFPIWKFTCWRYFREHIWKPLHIANVVFSQLPFAMYFIVSLWRGCSQKKSFILNLNKGRLNTKWKYVSL